MENVVVEGHILCVHYSFCSIASERKLLNVSGLSLPDCLSAAAVELLDSCMEFNLWILCRSDHIC